MNPNDTGITTVVVNNNTYQIGKLLPEAGGFILLRLLGAGIQSGAAAQKQQDPPPAPDPDAKPLTGDEAVRAIAFGAFMRNLPFEEFKFVQQGCMKSAAWLSDPKTPGVPMPLMNDYGQWTYPWMAKDLDLVMKLTMEVLVWNLSDFFSGGGLASLMKASTAA
jgi:hypothetical protein